MGTLWLMRVVVVAVVCASLAAACGGGSKQGASPSATAGQSAAATVVVVRTVLTDGNAPGIPSLSGPVQTSSSGLWYIDETTGDGASPRPDQMVTVHTTIWLVDGHKIDSTRDRNQSITFALSRPSFAGLGEGISTMRIGGKRRLIVPPDLGYGPRPVGGAPGGVIPANSTLIVDVELLSVQ